MFLRIIGPIMAAENSETINKSRLVFERRSSDRRFFVESRHPKKIHFCFFRGKRFGKLGIVGITPQQFARMKDRLAPGGRLAAPVLPGSHRSIESRHQIILGVDPSLRGTGFGVIRLARPNPVTLTHGTISCPAGWERSRCLVKIAQTLRDVIKSHHPTVCAIEGLFFAQNLQTALIMGEARGAALVAIAEAGLEIFEVAPRKVKQSIVGYGAAQKIAVAKMVQRILALPELPSPDAADALALALTQAQDNSRYSLVAQKKV